MIQSERLTLIPVRQADWVDYGPILKAPETSQFSNMPKKVSEKKIKALVDWMVRITENGKGHAWMIRTLNDQTLVGCIRLNEINKQNSIATIGYELNKNVWGRGLMTEALEAVTAYCFNDLAIFRLEAWTYGENEASKRVLEKTKFRLEGIERAKILDKNIRHDRYLYARLAIDEA